MDTFVTTVLAHRYVTSEQVLSEARSGGYLVGTGDETPEIGSHPLRVRLQPSDDVPSIPIVEGWKHSKGSVVGGTMHEKAKQQVGSFYQQWKDQGK